MNINNSLVNLLFFTASTLKPLSWSGAKIHKTTRTGVTGFLLMTMFNYTKDPFREPFKSGGEREPTSNAKQL